MKYVFELCFLLLVLLRFLILGLAVGTVFIRRKLFGKLSDGQSLLIGVASTPLLVSLLDYLFGLVFIGWPSAFYYLVPMLQDGYWGEDFSTIITYTVTCNTEDYFSVLLRTEKNSSGTSVVQWKGQVFSREYAYGATCTLPVLLGILDQNEKDEQIQNYQTEKVSRIIREMVWNLIEEGDSQALADCLTEEDLAYLFFPAEDFYLDENGDPVFYLQPYYVLETVPDNAELITFTIPFEDILDEL